ncbi:MAG: restriction endonuclease subunit S [Fibrobacter sp.]|nr:restriction endonuclease subunit S [Fibrobacter sp.]MDY6370077.1 restriction endonuclease subunit S [Fibrobacter sp.]MDY6389560.1 restriction endonuclease subunit S [Fibrobacter sp.]
MDGKQLKNSILQWAIQGKLVPQNPKDEPAQKLLERIAAYRNEGESSKGSKKTSTSLRGAKATKQSKTLSSRIYRENGVWYEQVGSATPKDITDEIPFEIPETWAWCRIGDIFYHTSGKQQSSSNKKGSPQKFITTSNLYWGRFVLDNVKVMNFTDEEIKSCSATKGDLLVCEGGAGYGRSAIWNEDYDICLQNHIHRLRPCVNGICEYVYYFIYLLKETNRLVSVGTAMPGLSANRLKGLILPLPPLAEQKRIVAKLEQALPLAEEYGAAQEQLDKLNKELPEALKKSILQEAIQGKLVPQNPKDEPASVLLAKIRKEKESLVKQGLLKKSAFEEIPIDEDEKLFDIPESWEWCNFSMIAETSLGKTKSPHKDKGKPLKYLCSINVYWNEIRLNTVKEMPFSEQEKVKYAVRKGDLLICEGGECGRAAIWNKDEETLYQNALHRVRFYKGIDARYFMHCLFFYKNTNLLDEHIKGETIKHLVQNELDSIVFPLPPLAEQKRIVAKLEQLFKAL